VAAAVLAIQEVKSMEAVQLHVKVSAQDSAELQQQTR
jgi:hypothetical protein